MPPGEPSVCGWAGTAQDYIDYRDNEWGRVLRGDREMCERLTLEAFQSGLSWITILRKREAFRTAFARFDIAEVAAFTEADVRRPIRCGWAGTSQDYIDYHDNEWGRVLRGDREMFERLTLEAVSYTHLTLPTIY